MQIEPQVVTFPRIFKTPSRLECRFGWNDSSNKAFLENEFEQLVLQGSEEQEFKIPKLGVKAEVITNLKLQTSALCSGLEQFENVKNLRLEGIPSNSLPIELLKNVNSISVEWSERFSACLPLLENVKEFDCTYFKGDIAYLLNYLPHLYYLGFTYGNLKDISFLDKLNSITSFGLSHIKALKNINEIHDCRKLTSLTLENLPNVEGVLSLERLKLLKKLYIYKCKKLTINFENIKALNYLEELHLDAKYINLSFSELFTLKTLRKLTVPLQDKSFTKDEVAQLVSRNGRNWLSIDFVGPKNSKKIQIELEI
ncbi:hypothetical protein [Pseudoalteromonas sp. T1lg24]|uniref:hypothetical protein n=1 Tax=Pseudoalteromonas sp. T1lg24 TaxID=2077099 RepID=UPI000CF6A072|nr:hypothetical protein [Pseudoalteromonas sp. T1lg24]